MDKSSFQKLFKEMYQINPSQWNNLLTKAGKTVYSAKPKNANSKINRQSMASNAFDKLMKIDYKNFGNKQNATINKPKSICINDMTLGKMRDTNMKDSNAKTTFTDSSAIQQFRIDDAANGKKDVTIQFVGGGKDYLYPNVPANVANGLYTAPSKGSYVENVISKYSDYSNPKVQQKIREGE